jgi:hypothetical protein
MWHAVQTISGAVAVGLPGADGEAMAQFCAY